MFCLFVLFFVWIYIFIPMVILIITWIFIIFCYFSPTLTPSSDNLCECAPLWMCVCVGYEVKEWMSYYNGPCQRPSCLVLCFPPLLSPWPPLKKRTKSWRSGEKGSLSRRCSQAPEGENVNPLVLVWISVLPLSYETGGCMLGKTAIKLIFIFLLCVKLLVPFCVILVLFIICESAK